jgi:hypothetical protein
MGSLDRKSLLSYSLESSVAKKIRDLPSRSARENERRVRERQHDVICCACEARLLDRDDAIVRPWQRTEEKPEAEREITRNHTEVGRPRPRREATTREQIADASPREPSAPTKSSEPLARMRASQR